ncbi:MAG: smc, chromosome segregation ATPase, chromosome segregation protein [Candidatus Wolfebacteria bacterium GW2011_GWB1_47_1]|uniref:Smc, chromosome segregation ATPase, chromosome segregation protein n=1 Tax=Candidatus Wolfebacteria bacterium GW2011_GWB1_47_1 TaxID=1619007 RepID=A0A0G4ARZ0_9BACT|nr:MAG: smc, chromosome segregation ATPase, chromosome segregation protein [Candidatus Wolfebacteria bacterium GW2011_GWB1_47_1]
MLLKSLELNGFKSFAQKTVLEFPGGITAIVGPNGSGKSNVIDAIRWILGEREAKNLRGAKAEDLIFAGTPKRARSGIAQVSINFDNSEKFFPLDFDEVSVSREISRDGNSTYALNKSDVRAKDIIDFFARARLGTRGLTIINQGSSDLFVRATPQERRFMIEEILGLKEYQLKKLEAERKLKNTANNLEKVRIMIEEVTPRLRMLKRQVAKYQTRDQKQDELIASENTYFGTKTIALKFALRQNNSVLHDLQNSIGAKQHELTELEHTLTTIESTKDQHTETSALKAQETELLTKRFQLQKDIARLEAKLEFSTDTTSDQGVVYRKDEMLALIRQIKHALDTSADSEDSAHLSQTIKSVIAKIESYLNPPKLDLPKPDYSAAQEEIEREKTTLLTSLAELDEQLATVRSTQESLSQGLEDFNSRFREAFGRKEIKREEIRAIESRIQHLAFENEKLSIRLDDLRSEWIRNDRAESQFDMLIATEGLSDQDLLDLERQIFRLRAELLSIGDVDETLITEANEVEAHHTHLTTQSADLEKASVDLAELVEELKRDVSGKFNNAFKDINDQFNHFFRLMFGGGSAKMKIKTHSIEHIVEELSGEVSELEESRQNDEPLQAGIEIELSLPKKRINSLDVLSGGEKSLVSIAALFALISVSPPPFLVLDEIDAPLDERNSERFAHLIKEFAHKVQFIVVTHNRTIMEVADVLYGVTMNEDGTSKLLSVQFGSPEVV